MTIGDYIRTMNNDDLADLLAKIIDDGYNIAIGRGGNFPNTYSSISHWLDSEMTKREEKRWEKL